MGMAGEISLEMDWDNGHFLMTIDPKKGTREMTFVERPRPVFGFDLGTFSFFAGMSSANSWGKY